MKIKLFLLFTLVALVVVTLSMVVISPQDHVDALSPEARKPTVDRVKSAERSDPDDAIDDDADGSGGRNGTDTP